MTSEQVTKPTVVVVGGGYGGVNVAKALDDSANVILVEPKDAFMHNVAALRALVDPSFLPQIFLPYDQLLAHGRIVHDRAEKVDPHQVVTSSGEVISADYVVLATGSSYPFPAKSNHISTELAIEQIQATHRALSQADRVLLVGAGPVGIELAGEIKAVWPEKDVTLLDLEDQILGGRFKSELRDELRHQLDEIGVDVVLGEALSSEPPTEPGQLGSFTVTTESGRSLAADIWFRCYGVVPNSDYLGEELQSARRDDGHVEVGPTLQVVGQSTTFALGDLSTADAKMAGFAGRQAETVAANIRALSSGQPDLVDYESMGVVIVVTVGPTGGAGQLPGQEAIVGRDVVASIKGGTMMVDRYAELFGLLPVSAD